MFFENPDVPQDWVSDVAAADSTQSLIWHVEIDSGHGRRKESLHELSCVMCISVCPNIGTIKLIHQLVHYLQIHTVIHIAVTIKSHLVQQA